MREAQVGITTLFRRSDNHPVIPAVLLEFRLAGHYLAVFVGEFREMPGQYVITPTQRLLQLVLYVFLLVSEKFRVHVRNWSSAQCVRSEKVCAAIKRLFYQHGVINPDDDPTGIAVFHFRRQKIGSCLC